jgi:hypothetical protein
MAAQVLEEYKKSVFDSRWIGEYIESVKLKCKKSDPIYKLVTDVKLVTTGEIVDIDQESIKDEIIIFTDKSNQIIKWPAIYEMCVDVDPRYYFGSIKNALDKEKEDYDILFAVKDTEILGFLVTLKGECKFDIYNDINDMHAVHLVCASKTMKGLGSLLIGAYLYCISYIKNHTYGLLTLRGSVNNISGFLSYSKMGFSPLPELIGMGCFRNNDCLPMIIKIDKNTRQDVIERLLAKIYTENIGMSHNELFIQTYGDRLSRDQYLKIAEPVWLKYEKKCKKLMSKYYDMKASGVSLEGPYKNLIQKLKELEELKKLEAMIAFSKISLKPVHVDLLPDNEDYTGDDEDYTGDNRAKKRKTSKFLCDRKRSPVARKGSPATRKGSRSTRKGSPATRKRSPATRKGSRSTRKGSRATRKGSRSTRKGSRSTRKRSPVARKRSPSTQKRSPVARKGSCVARKGSPATRKKSPVARKGSRATRKNN